MLITPFAASIRLTNWVKQKFGVLGAAVGLGVELHGEAVPFQVVDALTGAVVGVEVAHLADGFGQGVRHNGVAWFWLVIKVRCLAGW